MFQYFMHYWDSLKFLVFVLIMEFTRDEMITKIFHLVTFTLPNFHSCNKFHPDERFTRVKFTRMNPRKYQLKRRMVSFVKLHLSRTYTYLCRLTLILWVLLASSKAPQSYALCHCINGHVKCILLFKWDFERGGASSLVDQNERPLLTYIFIMLHV